ncbi:MAG: plastocyanin/azurin family copper-binding protein [Chloroflexota bacterium]
MEELVTFLTASTDVSFTYDPNAGHEGAPNPDETPYVQTGWRDPNYEPAPGATPVPACWRNPSGQIGGSGNGSSATAAPVASPGTPDSPRKIAVDLTSSLTITDPDGNQLSSIAVKPGETVEFEVTNTAGFDHNFWIGPEEELSTTTGNLTDAPGVPEFADGTQTFTWTVPTDASGLQFACTVPGHYGTMHGDIVIQQ